MHSRTTRAVSAAALGLGLALASSATVALAHDAVIDSTPAADSTLTELPASFSVTASDDMLDLGGDGAGFAILITDEGGAFYGDGCATVSGPTLSTPAALGEPGAYLMTYQYVSSDGHTTSGEIPFSWQPGTEGEPHVGLDAPPVCGESASAPAPSASAAPTSEPVPSAEPTASAEPEQPADGSDELLGIAGIVVALIVIAGIIVAIVASTRARARRDADGVSDAAESVDGDDGSRA